MKEIFNKYIVKILILIFIVKLTCIVLLFFLPQSGIQMPTNKTQNLMYQNYKISSFFGLNAKEAKVVEQSVQKEIFKIDDLILRAVYNDKNNGFIVFAQKDNLEKNIILAKNQTYKGYKLIKIKTTLAILQKNNKNYELSFKEQTNTVPLQKRVKQVVKQDLSTDVLRAVNKDDVMYYAKNFDAIWKNIAIQEVQKDGQIQGFKVMSVNKNSIFGKLGLTDGDTILSVNNQPLKSYADAFNIYNNIGEYESMKITIIRDNEQKELEYEIH